MTQINSVAGDGGLTVGVSSTGAFGSNTGVTGASDAQYDPIGIQGVGDTTYQSDLAFRIGSTGARQFLSSLATNAVLGSSTGTVTNSSFIASGLKFELVQAVDDLKKDGQRTGSSLSQTYKITNPTSQAISFELVRYFDGDLLFDGSLADKGGKVTRNGQDILFETDSGDDASAPTTFVGITAKGGTDIASNRLEIGAFSSLRSRILSGNPLSDLIQGDTNGDSFIDGAAYDVTPAFRNVFEVAAGQSTTYVTETIFGSGAPNQVVLPQTISVAATDPIASENPGDPGTFTVTRTNSDLTQPLAVNYTLAGTATNGVDYTNLSNSVTFTAGQATATVTVAPIDDNIVEPTESVVLTLVNGTGYNLAADLTKAQVNITDNDLLLPSVTIAPGINATEPATNGTFILTRTGDLAAALIVNLATPTGTATSGVDYTALSPTATFAVGSATSTVTVANIDDTLVEPTETIGLALSVGAGYTLGTTTAATINLTDNDVAPIVLPSVTIASGINAAEPATNGTFILTRTGDLAAALIVNLATPTGTATSGVDYTALSPTATFAVGSATSTVTVANIDDTLVEPTETIGLALSAGAVYTLGTTTAATINLTDNDVAPQLDKHAQNCAPTRDRTHNSGRHSDAAGMPTITTSTRNDFNSDKKSDILWRNDNGNVALWQMNVSTVTSSSLTSISNLDSSWKVSGTGDFNGDSKTDVLWRNTNGAVVVWTMDGATVKSSSLTSTPSLDNSWKTVGTGDYNGDGKSDILWRNTNGAAVVWTMDGATVKSSSLTSTPSLDNSWKVAGNSDFDGDGKADILWRNDDGSVALWQMNGAGVTASTAVAKLSTDWKIAGTGDFNDDGKADILWRNDDGRVALWQMNGAAITSRSLTSTPSRDTSQTIAGLGDYNGDGKADILWRKDTGATEIWQMNGSTVVSSTLTSIAAESSNWKIAAPII
jgi:predicted  nucleic acid-binding Zn ribbon protein